MKRRPRESTYSDSLPRPTAPVGFLPDGHVGMSAIAVDAGAARVLSASSDGTPMVDSSLRWDPERSTCEPSGDLILARIGPGVTKLRDGRVLVAGGLDEAGKAVSAAELWDPITGTLASTGSLAKARFGHSSTLLSDGRVLVIGGAGLVAHGVETHATAEIWDPGSGTFHAATSLQGRWTADPTQAHHRGGRR